MYNVAMSRRLTHDAAVAIMRAAYVEPLDPYRQSDVPWRCRCIRCHREVRVRLRNVRSGRSACGHCTGRLVDPEEAIAAMCAAGLEPLEPYRGVMVPWKSQCQECYHEVSPLLNNIKKGQGGCAWCGGNRIDPEKAELAMRAAFLKPLVVYPGRHAPWKCQCQKCGSEVSPTYGAVTRGTGCRYCNDTTINSDVAAELMRSAYLEPLQAYPGSNKQWKCRCMKCKNIVSPCYSTIQRGNGGCRWCRDSGFKSFREATVYLLIHPGYKAAKVGITDENEGRLKKHRPKGWHVLCAVKVPGKIAIRIEDDIIDWWRVRLGLPIFLEPEDMPQGGYTETVNASAINLSATVNRILELANISEKQPLLLN